MKVISSSQGASMSGIQKASDNHASDDRFTYDRRKTIDNKHIRQWQLKFGLVLFICSNTGLILCVGITHSYHIMVWLILYYQWVFWTEIEYQYINMHYHWGVMAHCNCNHGCQMWVLMHVCNVRCIEYNELL